MGESVIEERIAAIRRFNRLHTQKIGVLHEGYLRSPYNLAESRVIYELGARRQATASELARDLELDPGYLSRIVRRFDKQGLIARKPSASDRRQTELRLTPDGRRTSAAPH